MALVNDGPVTSYDPQPLWWTMKAVENKKRAQVERNRQSYLWLYAAQKAARAVRRLLD